MSSQNTKPNNRRGVDRVFALAKQIECIDRKINQVQNRTFEDVTGFHYSPGDASLVRKLETKRETIAERLIRLA